ncbi:MAG: flagellar hook-length control protein FliK [Amphiplicatus sp.]
MDVAAVLPTPVEPTAKGAGDAIALIGRDSEKQNALSKESFGAQFAQDAHVAAPENKDAPQAVVEDLAIEPSAAAKIASPVASPEKILDGLKFSLRETHADEVERAGDRQEPAADEGQLGAILIFPNAPAAPAQGPTTAADTDGSQKNAPIRAGAEILAKADKNTLNLKPAERIESRADQTGGDLAEKTQHRTAAIPQPPITPVNPAAERPPEFTLVAPPAAAISHDASVTPAAMAAAPVDRAEPVRQIVAAIAAGRNDDTIEIELDPPELGRVRIHFHVERSDAVTATLASERGDTLNLLRRHADDFVRTLEQAGFGNVQLEFRAGGGNDFASREQGPAFFLNEAVGPLDEETPLYIAARSDRLLDRRV